MRLAVLADVHGNLPALISNLHVAILTTGGTIAMRHDAAAGGAIPLLGADELTAALPPGLPELETEEVINLPSSHFRLDTLWAIRERVAELVAESGVDGVVITHGTDTLEETAYLLDVTVPGDKPIVLTGAMRTASDAGYEGYANLLAAVRVAAAPQARGLGAVVVLNDEMPFVEGRGDIERKVRVVRDDWASAARVRSGHAPLVAADLELAALC